MYCAVTGSFNTVSVNPSVTVTESLVQVTVVAGPPVEIQVTFSCEIHLSISVIDVCVISTVAKSPD